jgi:agmatine/peptidylarginine deiminase
MAWPSRAGFWPDEEATARAYADVANTIAGFEPVRMLVPAQRMESARRLLGPGVAIVEMAIRWIGPLAEPVRAQGRARGKVVIVFE